jgi:DNA-binding TFAR19-related protein (PDSD5 family)
MMESEEDQIQKKLQKRYQDAMKRAQQEKQMAEISRRLLDDEAYERMTNIKSSNHELYTQLVNMLVSLAQQNRINGRVTGKDFRALLERVTQKEETSIEFKHK